MLKRRVFPKGAVEEEIEESASHHWLGCISYARCAVKHGKTIDFHWNSNGKSEFHGISQKSQSFNVQFLIWCRHQNIDSKCDFLVENVH